MHCGLPVQLLYVLPQVRFRSVPGKKGAIRFRLFLGRIRLWFASRFPNFVSGVSVQERFGLHSSIRVQCCSVKCLFGMGSVSRGPT